MRILIPIAILLAVYALIENRCMLRVRREKFGNGIKIVHVADLHKRRFGKDNKRLCERVCDEKPDIILISGDLVSRKKPDIPAAESVLRQLCSAAPVYMVYGNHEADLSPEHKQQFLNAVRRSGAVLLRNETVQLKINGRKISLSGLELPYTVYKNNGSYRDLDVISCADITGMLGEKPDGETVLLVHNPLFAEEYAQWGADYAVCGHVHGGAVMIPFTKIGLLSPERKFLPRYTKGVYTVDKMKLLLSGGLGKFRLFNPPEIVVYEL